METAIYIYREIVQDVSGLGFPGFGGLGLTDRGEGGENESGQQDSHTRNAADENCDS